MPRRRRRSERRVQRTSLSPSAALKADATCPSSSFEELPDSQSSPVFWTLTSTARVCPKLRGHQPSMQIDRRGEHSFVRYGVLDGIRSCSNQHSVVGGPLHRLLLDWGLLEIFGMEVLEDKTG